MSDIVPFGKYKGRPVEVMASDRAYCDWVMAQAWFKDRHQALYTVIVNNFQEPAETPEHNALQVLFLEHEYRLAFALSVAGDWIRKEVAELFDAQEHEVKWARQKLDAALKGRDALEVMRQEEKRQEAERGDDDDIPFAILGSGHYERSRRIYNSDITALNRTIEREEKELKRGFSAEISSRVRFEAPNDVGIDIEIRLNRINLEDKKAARAPASTGPFQFPIEIKPIVSDDYPAVLRQMRTNGAKYLFLEDYTGRGATRDQFIRTFEASGLHVVFKEGVDQQVGKPLLEDRGKP